LIEALERRAHQVQPVLPEGELDWEGWWQAAAADPVLAPLVAERNNRFGGETHPPDFTPPLAWHTAALREQASPTLAGCGATGSGLAWPRCGKARPVRGARKSSGAAASIAS